MMRDRDWHIQYEGLQDLCFTCGKYGHKEENCSITMSKKKHDEEAPSSNNADQGGSLAARQDMAAPGTLSGPWMVAQRYCQRSMNMTKGISGSIGSNSVPSIVGEINSLAGPSKMLDFGAKSAGSRYAGLEIEDELETKGGDKM